MNKMRCWLMIVSIFTIASQGFTADTSMLYSPRKWTSVSGAEITASFVKISGNQVILNNLQGEAIQIPRAKLSAADQLLIDEAFGRSDFSTQGLQPAGNTSGGAVGVLTRGAEYSNIQFFSEEVHTRAIIICMDISPSMIAKGVTQDVLTESIKILEDLNTGTKFNFIVYVDGGDPFTPQMVYATQENKDKAIAWLKQPFDGRRQGTLQGYSGGTPYQAICMSVEMGADTVFVLTDDPPYLKKGDVQTGLDIPTHMKDIENILRSIDTNTGKSVGIYPILYKPFDNARGEEAIKFYKRIASMTGGRCRVVRRTTPIPTPTTPPPNLKM